MKKFLSILLSCTFVFGMATGCKSKETSKKRKPSKKTTATKADDDDDDIVEEPTEKSTTTTEATTSTFVFGIDPSETKDLTYQTWNDPYGYTSIQAPANWEVSYVIGDLISFAVVAKDTTCPDRMLVFQLLATPFVRSQEAKDFYSMNYTDPSQNPYVMNPILTTGTTEGFFSECGEYVGIRNFGKICDLDKNNVIFNTIIEGTCQMESGNYVKGLFGGAVWDFGYVEAFGCDVGWYNVSDLLMMTCPEEDFTEWIPVMTAMLDSLTFSDAFKQERNREWQQILQTSQYLTEIADQMGDMLMDSWYYSQETQDILSQRQSDATLGRDRVVDTFTGDIYYAPPGFADHFPSGQYETLGENDPRYRQPVTGTIYY